jgi:hypothetical protein
MRADYRLSCNSSFIHHLHEDGWQPSSSPPVGVYSAKFIFFFNSTHSLWVEFLFLRFGSDASAICFPQVLTLPHPVVV